MEVSTVIHGSHRICCKGFTGVGIGAFAVRICRFLLRLHEDYSARHADSADDATTTIESLENSTAMINVSHGLQSPYPRESSF